MHLQSFEVIRTMEILKYFFNFNSSCNRSCRARNLAGGESIAGPDSAPTGDLEVPGEDFRGVYINSILLFNSTSSINSTGLLVKRVLASHSSYINAILFFTKYEMKKVFQSA